MALAGRKPLRTVQGDFCFSFLRGVELHTDRQDRQSVFEGGVVAFWYRLKVRGALVAAAGDHEEAIIRSHR